MRDGIDEEARSGGEIKSLRHGLQILDILVRSDRPLSATAIGAQIGLHQTSVSRIIRTLITEGFIRKTGNRGFVSDFGVFALGSAAVENLHLVETAEQPMREIVAEFPAFVAVLVTLWRGQLLHFVRTTHGENPIPFSSRGYPLHLSSAALRLILDMPREEGLAVLESSRVRSGWDRPTELVPETPEGVLDAARERFERGTLVLAGWVSDWHVAGSIDVEIPNCPPFVLSLYGRSEDASEDTVRLWLHEARRRLEKDFS